MDKTELNEVNDAMYNQDDRKMLVDFSVLFETDLGMRVLGYIETLAGVAPTLEPEEVEARETGKTVPICPIGMAKRSGHKAFYWRLVAMRSEGDRIRSTKGTA